MKKLKYNILMLGICSFYVCAEYKDYGQRYGELVYEQSPYNAQELEQIRPIYPRQSYQQTGQENPYGRMGYGKSTFGQSSYNPTGLAGFEGYEKKPEDLGYNPEPKYASEEGYTPKAYRSKTME